MWASPSDCAGGSARRISSAACSGSTRQDSRIGRCAPSAGQRRRIALASLWLCGVPLWILDEPNTNLDTKGQALVAGLIDEQLAGGGLVVAAVHQELTLQSGRRVDLVIPGGQ